MQNTSTSFYSFLQILLDTTIIHLDINSALNPKSAWLSHPASGGQAVMYPDPFICLGVVFIAEEMRPCLF